MPPSTHNGESGILLIDLDRSIEGSAFAPITISNASGYTQNRLNLSCRYVSRRYSHQKGIGSGRICLHQAAKLALSIVSGKVIPVLAYLEIVL
jgi:hypothetical protein